MNTHIPKYIHVTWVYTDLYDHPSPFIKNGLRNLKDLNPGWDLMMYDDDEVMEDIWMALESKDFLMVEKCSMVEKIDIWRLYKIYKMGGLYTDLDRMHNIPLENILDEQTRFVLPTCGDFDFSHTFMMSAPKNPIYLETLELLLQRRREGHKNIYFLGPQTYMHGVTKVLTGQMIDSNPGKEVFDQLRKLISKLPFIKTYRETGPGDLITNKSDITEEEYEKQKREFYAEFKIKHWTGEW